MHYQDVAAEFGSLRSSRRSNPLHELERLAAFAVDSFRLLRLETVLTVIDWRGSGNKDYAVAATGHAARWSRPLNLRLLMPDENELETGWGVLIEAIRGRGEEVVLEPRHSGLIDRVLYSSAMAYAALVDLHGGGSAGTAFEMYCGTIVSALSGLEERGDIVLETASGASTETVKIDIHFQTRDGEAILCLPTKISTRERITQVFVHARILNLAVKSRVRTALCVVNETNAFKDPAGSKSVSDVYLRETLVPGTIALYQKYIHPIDSIYYLDPPKPYLDGTYAGLPPVSTVGGLLTSDLAFYLLEH